MRRSFVSVAWKWPCRTAVLAATTTALAASLTACQYSPPAATHATALERAEALMHSGGDPYERYMGRWSQRLAVRFLEFAAVRDGDHVLDVGCGTGSLTFAILARNQTARVTGIDLSANYIRFARAKLDDERASRVSFEQGDAQRLRFDDDSFDKTVSLLVMNFIPDRDAATREMMRVTRPGGVVAAAVWDYGDGMEMLRIFWDEAVALDPASEKKDERHMPLCRKGELAQLWRQHGMLDVREEPLVIMMEFASFDDYWQPFLGGQGPGGAYVAALPEAQRAKLEQRLRRRLLGDKEDGRITLKARAWAASGVVPRGRPSE